DWSSDVCSSDLAGLESIDHLQFQELLFRGIHWTSPEAAPWFACVSVIPSRQCWPFVPKPHGACATRAWRISREPGTHAIPRRRPAFLDPIHRRCLSPDREIEKTVVRLLPSIFL